MYERTRPFPSENRKIAEKRCKDCGEVLPISEFDWNERGDWDIRCKKCSSIWSSRYSRRRIALSREWLNDIKRESGCIYCGENEPVALLFHHRDAAAKKFTISNIVGYSRKTIMGEVAKCDILCRNCHAKLHAGRLSIQSKHIDAI